jgi:hypothetical protein
MSRTTLKNSVTEIKRTPGLTRISKVTYVEDERFARDFSSFGVLGVFKNKRPDSYPATRYVPDMKKTFSSLMLCQAMMMMAAAA